MPTVVADSSSFIHLAAIGRVSLLRELYTRLLVPPAVWHEVVVAGRGRHGEADLRRAVEVGWVAIGTPLPNLQLPSGTPPLHPGEVEAIHLALGHPDSLLVMDEAVGRAVAVGLGLKVIGIVGILVLAKQRGLIPSLSQELQRLRGPGRFRLSSQIMEHALRFAGEK